MLRAISMSRGSQKQRDWRLHAPRLIKELFRLQDHLLYPFMRSRGLTLLSQKPSRQDLNKNDLLEELGPYTHPSPIHNISKSPAKLFVARQCAFLFCLFDFVPPYEYFKDCNDCRAVVSTLPIMQRDQGNISQFSAIGQRHERLR